MERRVLRSELDGNPAERCAIWSHADPRFSGHRLHSSPTTTLGYTDVKVYPCTDVTTVIPRMAM